MTIDKVMTQHINWKPEFTERLQRFSNWDDHYQILSSVGQSTVYKALQQLRMDTFISAGILGCYELIISTHANLVQRVAECDVEIAKQRDKVPQDASQAVKACRDMIRDLVSQHNNQIRSLQTSQTLLASQREALLTPISYSVLKQQIDNTCEAMQTGLTSMGVGRLVNDFFEDLDNNIQHVEREIERVNSVLASIYQRPEHNLKNNELLTSKLLNISKQRQQLQLLQKRATSFQPSFATLCTRKQVLSDRFVETLAKEANDIYLALNQHIERWLKEALLPLFENNRQQKAVIDDHKQRLDKMETTAVSSDEQMVDLEIQTKYYQAALFALAPMYQESLKAKQEMAAQAAQIQVAAAEASGQQVAT